MINRVHSKSYIAILDDDEKARLTSRVQEVVQKGEDKIWIDEKAGVFQYPYQTHLVSTNLSAISFAISLQSPTSSSIIEGHHEEVVKTVHLPPSRLNL